jgi:hypothetical protein
MIRASAWYRKKLVSEISDLSIEAAPDKVNGLEMLEYNINPTPSTLSIKIDFNNNSLICSDEPRQEKKGFFDKVGFFLNKAKVEVGGAIKKVGDKVKDMDIPDKLKTASDKAVDIAKTAGGFVVEKGKEVYVK